MLLGSCEILEQIGAGGMGEVYRGRDTRLGRDVAVKALPDNFSSSPEHLARFEREAQVLAALNHPNIAVIHDLKEVNGAKYLILELVEGETLAEHIARGPIPLDETLNIAKQIAEALEAAHEKGIVHRDLKPANIKLTPEGKVKVLDFGLAKAVSETRDSSLSNSPTLSIAATQQGIILGTAAYMSPEQARGRTVDNRTDVWAFGCVLYEMLTGRRAFEGSDISEILATVIKTDPDWTLLPKNMPATLVVFLRRCLEKNPKRRVHDIADMRLALEGAFDIPATPSIELPVAIEKPRIWRLVIVALGALAIGAAITGLLVWSRTRPTSAPMVRVGVISSTRPGTPNVDEDIAISPDGSHIVYLAGDSPETAQIFVRSLDQLAAVPIRGLMTPRLPFISPDGNWIGFFEGTKLKKVAMNGGPAVTICGINGAPRGASWGSDEQIVIATSDTVTGLMSVAAGGGEPKVLTKPDPAKGELDHYLPEVLPGGKAVLFTIIPRGGIENSQIAVLDLTSGKQEILIRGGSNPRYSPTGHIVYASGGSLRAVGFDLDRLQIRGTPIPVLEHVLTKTSGAADFAIAGNGSLVYVTGDVQLGVERTLVWVDRQGHEEAIPAPPRSYAYPRVSPDGTRVALDIRDQDNDIWIWDLMRRTLTRLTFDPGLNRLPAWTPDGKRIAFSAQKDAAENIYWQAADGTGTAERLTQGPLPQVAFSFLPDGTRLIYGQPDAAPFDIGIVDLKGEHKSELVLHEPFSETNAEFSPDGKWIVYESDESGKNEIYVRPFPNTNGGRWQISVGGGTRPVWARNGRELFYLSNNKVMSVSIASDGSFAAGNPQMVFEGSYVAPLNGRTYDVSPDGKRFLMIKNARRSDATATSQELILILNWFEELKQRVPITVR